MPLRLQYGTEAASDWTQAHASDEAQLREVTQTRTTRRSGPTQGKVAANAIRPTPTLSSPRSKRPRTGRTLSTRPRPTTAQPPAARFCWTRPSGPRRKYWQRGFRTGPGRLFRLPTG
eukprot:g18948.t1